MSKHKNYKQWKDHTNTQQHYTCSLFILLSLGVSYSWKLFPEIKHAAHRNSDSTEFISFTAGFQLILSWSVCNASWSSAFSFGNRQAPSTDTEKSTLTTLNFPHCLPGSQEEGKSTCMESFVCLWRQQQADLV